MAAFTGSPLSSPLILRQTGVLKADRLDNGGDAFDLDFTYTHLAAQGSGTGEIDLCMLPASKIRIYVDNCRLVTSQFGASATISIGWRAYVDASTGAAVAASAAGFHSAGAAGAGALDVALALPAIGVKEFDSRDGVIIFATIASGDIDATDTIYLHFSGARVG